MANFPDNISLSRLADRAAGEMRERVVSWAEEIGPESPIERLLLAALYAVFAVRHSYVGDLIVFQKSGKTKDQLASDLYTYIPPVQVECQKDVEGARVDFLVSVKNMKLAGELVGGVAQLIVECDGHEFHERTKDQAERDRSRDRRFQEAGYTVFRFTGAELYRNAWDCADQVLSWAESMAYK